MISKERVIQTFIDLCSINSPSLYEREIGDYIKDYCKRLGLKVIEDNAGKQIEGNCGNILVELPGKGNGFFNIFLSAHMDTVESTKNLQIIRENGTIKTDGRTILGADDKIGIAALLEGIHSLIDSGEDYASGFILFTIAEEKGLLGASLFHFPKEAKLDFGFIFDTGPEVGCVVIKTPFHYEFKATVEGLAAHAGREPEKGINAIQLAARALAYAPQGRIDEESTCNYGIIQGGEMRNVVCSKVEIKGEIRSFSELKAKNVLENIKKSFQTNIEGTGGKYNLDVKLHSQPYCHNKTDDIIRYIIYSLSKIGKKTVLKSSLGSSDANIWNLKGIPCINIGVGMQNIHTCQEYCHEEDIYTVVSITRSILQTKKDKVSSYDKIRL